jgi:hypothetical protein
LDFAKAYDTLERPFLLQLMSAMGVGPEYCKWVKTLLTDMRARACMNGFVSGMRMFYAGVRQGCPLSPLLYLFVGEALFRYLQSKGIYINVHGIRMSATQFADNTQVYLESPAHVAQFLTHMQLVAAASGQKLNLQKSKLLLLGAAARQQHSTFLQQHTSGALPLSPVLQANVLGVCVGSDSPVDWDQKVANVEAALQRLSHLPQLSVFGRSMGSAAYGVSTFLYAAEFSDLPFVTQ